MQSGNLQIRIEENGELTGTVLIFPLQGAGRKYGLLRFAVAQAYFRAWIFRNGGSTNELPEWVVQGAVRAANAEKLSWSPFDKWLNDLQQTKPKEAQ